MAPENVICLCRPLIRLTSLSFPAPVSYFNQRSKNPQQEQPVWWDNIVLSFQQFIASRAGKDGGEVGTSWGTSRSPRLTLIVYLHNLYVTAVLTPHFPSMLQLTALPHWLFLVIGHFLFNSWPTYEVPGIIPWGVIYPKLWPLLSV